MAYLRPPRSFHATFLIALVLACFLTGGAPASAGLRPDPKPPPKPQPLPEPPPQTVVSPQPPPAQPPVSEPAPPVAVRAPNPPARTTPVAKRRPAREARRAAKRAAARVRREQAAVSRTAAVGTHRATTPKVAPLAFADSQSNVGPVVLIAMMAIAAALLLFGFGAAPALAARWPAARALDDQRDLVVTIGFAMVAASAAFLLVILVVPE